LTSAAKRHLEEDKPGYNIFKLGTTLKAKLESTIHDVLMAGSKPISQAVANKLSSFYIYRFRLAAVRWLIKNNHPLSEFEKLAFRRLICLANPLAKDAL
jgi:hypothetical protein